jgi:serine protease DegQ
VFFKRLWLIFAQAATMALAVWGAISIWAPGLLPPAGHAQVATLTQAAASSPPKGRTDSYRDAAHKATPAMVNIFTRKSVRVRPQWMQDPLWQRFLGEDFGSRIERSTSLGSGVIVSPEGYVVTNNHVVEAADEIAVALSDGREFKARLVGADADTDLAVLKINAGKLPAVTFGHSETLQVGDVVLAIGNPFGVGQTVTMGIVSALGRSKLGINTFENFIQTDAPINPGNSGGALVDTQGQLLGINTAIYSKSGGSLGIGFAIPETTVREVLQQLIEQGRVVRGWIGIATQDLSRELAASLGLQNIEGVIVTGVLDGAPAALSGLLPGDVITQINAQPTRSSDQLRQQISRLAPGQTAQLQVWRRQQTIDLDVTVAARPNPVAADE